MTMLAFAFLQHSRLKKARWGKKNQRTAASTKLADVMPSSRSSLNAAEAMPALPQMDMCEHAA
jgi:hypothetical protein